jgi:hypothetical protein
MSAFFISRIFAPARIPQWISYDRAVTGHFAQTRPWVKCCDEVNPLLAELIGTTIRLRIKRERC